GRQQIAPERAEIATRRHARSRRHRRRLGGKRYRLPQGARRRDRQSARRAHHGYLARELLGVLPPQALHSEQRGAKSDLAAPRRHLRCRARALARTRQGRDRRAHGLYRGQARRKPERSRREQGVTDVGRLDGKSALITGGSRGIGAATALRFAREGARVGIMGKSEKNLATMKQSAAGDKLTIETFSGDVGNKEDAARC